VFDSVRTAGGYFCLYTGRNGGFNFFTVHSPPLVHWLLIDPTLPEMDTWHGLASHRNGAENACALYAKRGLWAH
jgi:hypothetical protein